MTPVACDPDRPRIERAALIPGRFGAAQALVAMSAIRDTRERES
jgi:hypothetical protein